MAFRLGACSILAAALAVAPLDAQAVRFELSGGGAVPVGPTRHNVSSGGTFGLGLSHRVATTSLFLGVEATLVNFGATHVTETVYAPSPVCCPTCLCAPLSTVQSYADRPLAVTNYFVTGKYLIGAGTLHPYVAVAGGLTQQWGSTSDNSSTHSRALGVGERASCGVESRVGRLGVAVDVAYATESAAEYAGRFVRYVPVTLRLSF